MAMLIFSMFLTIVVTTVVSVTRASTRVQVRAVSSSQELAVFQSFDRQIRYADAINVPGTGASGDTYIEFRTPASSTANNVTTCTQWQYVPATGLLRSRQWADTAATTPAGTWAPTLWHTELSNIANDGGADYPFTLVAASIAGSAKQQLDLHIDTGNAAISGAAITTTFVARNSSISSDSNHGIPVCPASGSRL